MERTVAEVFPPGEFLREELEARGWSQQDLAAIIGKSENLVSLILNGKRSVTPETAVALGDAFGTSAEYWMNLETIYQLNRAPREPAVSLRAQLYQKAPVKEMVKRGWIEDSENAEVLKSRILSFFEQTSLSEGCIFDYAARKAASYSETTPAQSAWLFRARQLARASHVDHPWKPKDLRQLVAELSQLTLSLEEARHVPWITGRLGVRFVVVEPIAQCKIDGACFWLDAHSPVIAVSLRYDRIDNFWFTVMHEMGHIGQNDKTHIDVDILDSADKPEEEREADAFATQALIPQDALRDFCTRVGPLYSRINITRFAAVQRVHPGIVIGQLARAGVIPWSHMRDMLVKIRKIVTASALTDGWGCRLNL